MEKEILQKNDKKMSLEELEEILYYLEEKGKILVGEKGIVWIYNESLKLKKTIEEGLEV